MQEDRSGIDITRLASGEAAAIDEVEDRLAIELARHPQWAELLLPLLSSGNTTIVTNARRLLCLFDDEALLTIARGFETEDATARMQILGILWAYLIGQTPNEREVWTDMIVPYIRPGLSDQRKPERFYSDPERLEFEHDYRICDETYLFINRLLDSAFDDSSFEKRDEDARQAIAAQYDRRIGNLFGTPGAAAKKAARQPTALSEITIVAKFPNAYATPDTQEERDQAKAGKWAPARRDFMAVAAVDTPEPGKAIFEVDDVMAMFGAILFVDPKAPDKSAFRPAQSLKRVNIISHGNPGIIAMSGTVDKQGGVMLSVRGPNDGDLTGPLDIASVQAASNPNILLANGKPLALSLRDRFAPDAEIYLLACHTGMGMAVLLMKDMKDLFKVKIQAFSEEIAFCPSLNNTVILDRTLTAIKDCNSGSTSGFKHLRPDKVF
jgi:hypothetical protein